MKKKGEAEKKLEREESTATILDQILSEDEKILWRGRIAERVWKKFQHVGKLFIFIFLVLLSLGVVLLIIYLIIGELTKASFIFMPFMWGGLLLLSLISRSEIGAAEKKDYIITSKKIIEIDHDFLPLNVTAIDLEKIDEVIFNYRFCGTDEYFFVRGNVEEKAIRQIEFYSEYLVNHHEECVFVIENGVRRASEEYLEGNNCLKFMFLEDWKKAKEILRGIIGEKF